MAGRFATLTLALAVVLASGPARAQTLEEPGGRQGYYLALGGYGVVDHTTEKGESLGAWGGSSFTLRFGQLLTRRFSLGLQIDSGGAKGRGQQGTFAGLSLEGGAAVVGNLAVRGGVGVGFVSLRDPAAEGAPTRGAAGSYYLLGASYDFFPGRTRRSGGFSISPTVQARFLPSTNVSTTLLFIGVDFVWWTGLPDNQLNLPDAEAYRRR